MSLPHVIVKLNHHDTRIAAQIEHISKLAYAVEAELIGFSGIPYLHQSLGDIQRSPEIFLGYSTDGIVVGVLSYKLLPDNIVDIYRLVVHPEYFRKGIAWQLLHHLLREQTSANMVMVSTSDKNVPAIRLYTKAGFVVTGAEVIEQVALRIVKMEKQGV